MFWKRQAKEKFQALKYRKACSTLNMMHIHVVYDYRLRSWNRKCRIKKKKKSKKGKLGILCLLGGGVLRFWVFSFFFGRKYWCINLKLWKYFQSWNGILVQKKEIWHRKFLIVYFRTGLWIWVSYVLYKWLRQYVVALLQKDKFKTKPTNLSLALTSNL